MDSLGLNLGRRNQIWQIQAWAQGILITYCHILCCGQGCCEKNKKTKFYLCSLVSINFSFFPSPFCLHHSPVGLCTPLRLHKIEHNLTLFPTKWRKRLKWRKWQYVIIYGLCPSFRLLILQRVTVEISPNSGLSRQPISQIFQLLFICMSMLFWGGLKG